MDSADGCTQSYTVHAVQLTGTCRYFLFSYHSLLIQSPPRSRGFLFLFFFLFIPEVLCSQFDSPMVVAGDKALWVMKEHRLKIVSVHPSRFSPRFFVVFFAFSQLFGLINSSQTDITVAVKKSLPGNTGESNGFIVTYNLFMINWIVHVILSCFLFCLLTELPKNT